MSDFSPRRIAFLIRNRVLSDLTPIALGAAVLLGLGVLIQLMSILLTGTTIPRKSGGGMWPWPLLVVLACFLTSSRAFRDMQSAKSATDWILLPATSIEKYLAIFLTTQFVVPVLTMLLGLLLWLFDGFSKLPSFLGQWEFWGMFLVINLVLMTGSTFYRKLAGLKTLGTFIGFGILLVFLGILGVVLLGNGDRLDFDSEIHLGGKDWSFRGQPLAPWVGTFLTWFWSLGVYLVTPLCALAFGFFRVKEKEARDAVQ